MNSGVPYRRLNLLAAGHMSDLSFEIVREENIRANVLPSAHRKEAHLLLRNSTIIPGTESKEKFLLWVLIKRMLWHSEQCPQEIVTVITSESFMGLFVTESFSAGPGQNAKVKAQFTRGISGGATFCAFPCSPGLIHELVLMVPLCELNYISGNLPRILFS